MNVKPRYKRVVAPTLTGCQGCIADRKRLCNDMPECVVRAADGFHNVNYIFIQVNKEPS